MGKVTVKLLCCILGPPSPRSVAACTYGGGVFSGTHFLTIDNKGRLVMPAPLRPELGSVVVLTRAPGECLLLFPERQWRRLVRRNRRNEQFLEYFVSGAAELSVDPHSGRVVVPPALRDHAGLYPGTQAAVAGIGSAALACTRENWRQRIQRIGAGLLARLEAGQEEHEVDEPEP